MDDKIISAELRKKLKKSATKSLRESGRIPAVIYGHNDPVHISVDEIEFTKKFEKISENTIISVKVGKKSYEVLVKDFQDDIITQKIKHIDFFEIEAGRALKTNIPLQFVGTAAGVKAGGLLEVRLHDIEIECLPKDIPENFSVDISALETGEAIHVGDIKVPDTIRVVNSSDQTVVSVTLVKETPTETEEDEDIEESEEQVETEEKE